MRTWSFAKGHGTLNDFVLIQDRSAMLNPSVEDVRFLCDRRAGVGADGLLRAVKAEKMPDWSGPGEWWFMDYRNADGSIAQTCGNGLRVFVRWLLDENLVSGDHIDVATRAGARRATVNKDGTICVTMGVPHESDTLTTVGVGSAEWQGRPVDVGNPHCVIRLGDPTLVAGLDLSFAPSLDPGVFPEGANVEFAADTPDGTVAMRVFERGVGETMSCGTGVVAVALDHLNRTGRTAGTCVVEVPGGTLRVDITSDGEARLTGPAVIVARGEVTLPHG
ncbi:MAG: diaminopimelate epimerase [Propionibacteriaceae bacterium]|nr:diaminopimelate epimerase [Propionibacteriaceae bacterium]